MKRTANFFPVISELDHEELSVINGGSFAYDLGTFLRWVAIYAANGPGPVGTGVAWGDYYYNQIKNGE